MKALRNVAKRIRLSVDMNHLCSYHDLKSTQGIDMKKLVILLVGLLSACEVISAPTEPTFLTGAQFHLYKRQFANYTEVKDTSSASVGSTIHTDASSFKGNLYEAYAQTTATSSGVLRSYVSITSGNNQSGDAVDVYSEAILGDSITGPASEFDTTTTVLKLSVDGIYKGTLQNNAVVPFFDVYLLAPGGLSAFATYFNAPTTANESKAYSYYLDKRSVSFSSSTGDSSTRSINGFQKVELFTPAQYDLMVVFGVEATVIRSRTVSPTSNLIADFSNTARVSLSNADGPMYSASGLLPGTLALAVPEAGTSHMVAAGVFMLLMLRARRAGQAQGKHLSC